MVSIDTTAQKAGVPAGEYNIVAWDLDTTGRRLIDEFCHVAGFTPDSQFSQYVMPYKDLDLISKRRHQMRTVTVGRYRMLKDLKTGKFLKTKSEISALTDFLTWLEKIKGENGPSIILLNYETFKLAPSLLIEALNKYQLMDRFKAVVKGFGNCYEYVKEKCDTTLTSFSLRVVTKVLLDKEDDISTASDRARLTYEILQHLTVGDVVGEGDTAGHRAMVEAIRAHSTTLDDEQHVIDDMKVVLERQNTLRPVFAPLMKVTLWSMETGGHQKLAGGDKYPQDYKAGIQQRKSASALRRLLTGAFLDYDSLKALWDEGKENFEINLGNKLSEATEEQKKEICKMLSDHFDPAVKEAKAGKKPRNPRKGTRASNAKDEAGNSSDGPTTPDTTTTNTTQSSPSKSNGVNTPLVESPKHEPPSSTATAPAQQATTNGDN